MKPFQALVSDDGMAIQMVSLGGPQSILEAVAAATKTEIESGGKRYGPGERGSIRARPSPRRRPPGIDAVLCATRSGY